MAKGNNSSVTREIKARLSIIDIVKRYVDLRLVGGRWVAPCPFHQETKPSFSVNEEQGFFYCFGCQAAGDLFDFYSRINGLEFRETLEQLAEEAHVPLTGFKEDPKAASERDFRKIALQMYKAAARHFRSNLGAEAGAACREYLTNRKLAREIIDSFELGWSLPGWQGLADSLRRSGFTEKQAVEAGLLAQSERGRAYDRFRSRLIFPIYNLTGQVIAFGGRIIGDEDAAKYINSTDSPLYKKGDNLYGLYQARRAISVKKSAILTEGYMDVLTLHQFGYTNACGVLGTALTPEQVKRLSGFCSDIELIFDGDGAGRKAALRAAEMVLTKGLSCKVVCLPEKEDIDSLLQEQGPEAFEELRRFSPDGLDFCIRTLASAAPKVGLDWAKHFLAQVESPELLPRFVSRLCQGLELDEREIRRGLGLAAEKNSPPSTGGQATGRPAPVVNTYAFDRVVMNFVARYPHHIPALSDAGALLLLTESWALSLWEKVANCAPGFEQDTVLGLLDDKEKEFWIRCRAEAPPMDHQHEELADMCAHIQRRCRDRQDKACKQALRHLSAKGDYDLDLLKALNETLVKQRRPGSYDG